MTFLLSVSRGIDALNERVGKAVIWLVLVMTIISAGNAVMRYTINYSSNGLLEIQWYLFAVIFLFSAGYTLLRNEHVRIDVVAGKLSPRGQAWIDIIGTLLFLMPMAILIMYLSWPIFMNAWDSGEMSSNPGGLIRWPARLMIPVGFLLLVLQGFSELIKRFAFLKGLIANPMEKHKGPSAEEELAAAIQARKEEAK
ncbi:C4-dicarboxylate ABC transporter substrate-binding protein [Azospira sp. I13]|uniref:TRAP transporter small permease subunit n=1 Tax=Azospira sp. I13 TaxID=1765050 RepID=UPI000D49EE38|nr:TRAP transporter small permease subunit [Azospira sp. I13]GBG02378.1 C4-dicarboxylate ABC transporter substrate-binding protein [Azospira sp. I13]